MQSVKSIDPVQLALLHQLFAAATHEASAAMSRWTHGLITLTLDETSELPLEEVAPTLNLGDDLLTMVVLSLEGDLGGDMILTFDDENGRQLAASLVGRPSGQQGPWSELEISALNETGNILSCAYLNALQRLIGNVLVPSPPYFIQDFGASVLEQALHGQAEHSDFALVCRTRFQRDGADLNWCVLFLPNATLRQAMEHALLSNP